jgi:hypothetical protein
MMEKERRLEKEQVRKVEDIKKRNIENRLEKDREGLRKEEQKMRNMEKERRLEKENVGKNEGLKDKMFER